MLKSNPFKSLEKGPVFNPWISCSSWNCSSSEGRDLSAQRIDVAALASTGVFWFALAEYPAPCHSSPIARLLVAWPEVNFMPLCHCVLPYSSACHPALLYVSLCQHAPLYSFLSVPVTPWLPFCRLMGSLWALVCFHWACKKNFFRLQQDQKYGR